MNSYQQQIQWAVLLSLALHAVAFGVAQARQGIHAWQTSRRPTSHAAPAVAANPRQPTPTITFVEAPATQPATAKETKPQIFIETDPRQAAPAATEPAPTPYYSTATTVAANPENPTQITGDTPYLDGTDTKVLSTENVPLPTPGALALSDQLAAAARAQPSPGAQALIRRQLAQARAAEGLRAVEPPAPGADDEDRPERPGAADSGPASPAIAALQPGMAFPGREIAARQTQLTASGVSRTGVAAFNVASSPFGEYDRRLIRAVQQRWHALIERFGVYERAGTVTLHFQLYADGSIRNLQRRGNTAGEILALYCEKAVTDAAPFEPLTPELVRLVGGEPRDVDFTFYY